MHLLFSSEYGGAEKTAIEIIKKKKETNKFIYVSRKGNINKQLDEQNITYYLLDNINFFSLKKIITENNVQIIHAHDFRASILASFFSKYCKIISHIHQAPIWLEKKNIKSLVYNYRTRKFQKIYVVSKNIIETYPYPTKKRFELLENQVDTPSVVCSNKIYDFMFLGRLEIAKDPISFLEFIKSYQKESSQKIKSIIIGAGSLEKELKEYAYVNDLDVEFIGFSDFPYSYIVQAKYMMVTSQKEGFGIGIIESMQLGVPIITKKIGGVTDELTSQNAIIYQDTGELIRRLKNIDSEKYNQLSKNAKQFGNKFRSKSKDEIEDIYYND